ncbi:MAG: hypothetical protein WAQ27_04630 [Candidatus Microsaccharimonas sp.]
MTNLTKQKILFVLLWAIVISYFVINVAILGLSLPFKTVVILLPIINIILIITWVLVKTYYNKVKGDVQAVVRREGVVEEKLVRYGTENAPTDYVPDLNLDAKTFELIKASELPQVKAGFDATLSEYFLPGRIIKFHHVDDYGSMVEVQVVSAKKIRNQITATIKIL